jgi:hypothetical protein
VISDNSHIIDLKDNVPTKGYVAHGIATVFKACTEKRLPPITISIEYMDFGDLTLYGSFTTMEPNAKNNDFVRRGRPEKHVV